MRKFERHNKGFGARRLAAGLDDHGAAVDVTG
jgi:hypothetical protein